MTIKFRPQLLALEARDVPAAFSFRLPNGTTGHGTFATPDGVNPAQASQALAVPDLTVSKGGVSFAVQPGATANYANGVLVGVTASATGPGAPVVLNNATVQVGGYVAPVAYDAADTTFAFQFSNGLGGNISFTIPWDSVDESIASQTVAPVGLNLNISGQNFGSTANYTQLPQLHFEYGELVSVTFALNTSTTPNFAFVSISMAGTNLTGIATGTGQLLFAAAQPTRPEAALQFKQTLTSQKADLLVATKIHVRLETVGGKVYSYESTVANGMTLEDATALVFNNMKAEGWDVTMLPSGLAFSVSGWKNATGQLDKLKKAGITFEGAPADRQPRLARNGVIGEIYKEGQWIEGSWYKTNP